MKRPTRRDFLRTAAAGSLAAPALLHAYDLEPTQTVTPGDRVRIALIGAGGQGSSDTRSALRVPNVELVAVADIYDGRLARAKEVWGSQIFTTRDYREVLARPDVHAAIDTFPLAMQQQILDEYHATYPPQNTVSSTSDDVYSAPSGYSDQYDHFVTFISAAARKPNVASSVTGVRVRTAPALLTNDSYVERTPIAWNADTMKRNQS